MKNLTMILSPNRTSRKGSVPDVICCHQSNAPIQDRLRVYSDPKSMESVHFAVAKSGAVYQIAEIGFSAMAFPHPEEEPLCRTVRERLAAPDRYTVSVEFENEKSGILTIAQYRAGWEVFLSVIDGIRKIYGGFLLDREHFIGHYEIEPSEAPNCPGIDFPLNRYLADLKKILG